MYRDNSMSRFASILNTSPMLQEILKKTEDLIKLNHKVQEQLEPSLKPHCRVTNWRNGILVLTTSSPAYKHLLRFREIELLSILRADPAFSGIISIQSRVNPNFNFGSEYYSKDNFISHSGPSLSLQSSAIIQATASNIASDRLKKALLKIAKHAKHN